MAFGKKDIKENFFTGDSGIPSVEDAWRCDACSSLMYNVCLENGQTYPVPGAPMPNYLNQVYKKVCHACHAMYTAINDSDYFRTLSQNSVTAKKVKQKEWEGMG